MKFNELLEKVVVESYTDVTPQQIAKRFIDEVLGGEKFTPEKSKEASQEWITKTFCKWIKEYGIGGEEAIVLYMRAPEGGVSHLVPVFKNDIIDFTIGKLIPNRALEITPLNHWREFYGKWNYGQIINNKKPMMLGTYKAVMDQICNKKK